MNKDLKNKLIPISLAVLVVLLDQLTKAIIVAKIPPYSIGAQFFGDFLRIIHVSNTGVAFSIGAGWTQTARHIMFSLIPLIVVFLVFRVYFKNKDFTQVQNWSIMGIVGGGIGNIIDRIFRPEGVVDFIDVKFYGLFGLQRWPTFNVADAAVVVCGVMLFVSFIITSKKQDSKDTQETA